MVGMFIDQGSAVGGYSVGKPDPNVINLLSTFTAVSDLSNNNRNSSRKIRGFKEFRLLRLSIRHATSRYSSTTVFDFVSDLLY